MIWTSLWITQEPCRVGDEQAKMSKPNAIWKTRLNLDSLLVVPLGYYLLVNLKESKTLRPCLSLELEVSSGADFRYCAHHCKLHPHFHPAPCPERLCSPSANDSISSKVSPGIALRINSSERSLKGRAFSESNGGPRPVRVQYKAGRMLPLHGQGDLQNRNACIIEEVS